MLFQESSFLQNKLGRKPVAHHLNLPAEFSIDTARKLVTVRFRRTLIVEDIGRYVTSLRTNPSFQRDFSEIADLTEVEEVKLQADDFLLLADEVDPFSQEAKRAFVARTPVQTHAARMHKILRTNRNIQIFATIEDAERWILQ